MRSPVGVGSGSAGVKKFRGRVLNFVSGDQVSPETMRKSVKE